MGPYPNIDDILSARGGRLEPESVDGAAGAHLQELLNCFRGSLEPMLVPDPISPITRTTPPSRVWRFELVARWDVNAVATLCQQLDKTTSKPHFRPVVLFHAGVPFLLFEVYNALLARQSILPELSAESELTDQSIFAGFHGDYSAISRKKWPQTTDWSHYLENKPRGSQRRMLATQTYLVAIYFLFFHEWGHIELGHLRWEGKKSGNFSRAEFGISATNNNHLNSSTSQALECHADEFALRRTLSSHLDSKKQRLLTRTLGGAAAGAPERFRIFLFSVGVFLLVLDIQNKRWWDKMFGGRSETTHPNPLVRIERLFAVAIQMARSARGEAAMQEAISAVRGDLLLAASVLGADTKILVKQIRGSSAVLLDLEKVLKDLSPELRQCQDEISEEFFVRGTITSSKYKDPEPLDPYIVGNQSLEFYVDGETIEIPFLHDFDPIEQFISNSIGWEKVGYLDNALVYATLGVGLYPNDESARTRLERVKEKLGVHLAKFNQLVQKYGLQSHLADKLQKELGTSEERRDASKMIVEYGALAAFRPKQPLFRLQLGICKTRLRDYAGAVEDYEAVNLSADLERGYRLTALSGLGACLTELGRFDQAVQRYHESLEINPNEVGTLRNMATCLAKAGRVAEGIQFIEKALSLKADDADLWFESAKLFKTKGDAVEVRRRVEKGVELDPRNMLLRIARAQLFRESRQFALEAEELSTAIDLGADVEKHRFLRGVALTNVGQIASAIAEFAAVEGMAGEYAPYATKQIAKLRVGKV
jgi:tetratricopeptide (TPR) repeat protein